jgi:hypothetical protein
MPLTEAPHGFGTRALAVQLSVSAVRPANVTTNYERRLRRYVANHGRGNVHAVSNLTLVILLLLTPQPERLSPCYPWQVQCPRFGTGVICAESLSRCAASLPCPADMPVKCASAVCAASVAACPSLVKCADGSSALSGESCPVQCATGLWAPTAAMCPKASRSDSAPASPQTRHAVSRPTRAFLQCFD